MKVKDLFIQKICLGIGGRRLEQSETVTDRDTSKVLAMSNCHGSQQSRSFKLCGADGATHVLHFRPGKDVHVLRIYRVSHS